MKRLLLPILVSMASGASMAADPEEVATQHALALYGEPALEADFEHFPHANPDAPVGGTLSRAANGSSFDSTNPYIIQGTHAAGLSHTYDTLLTQSPDEAFTMYGLLASGIRLDPDRQWVEFDLHPEARFHDGTPVTAEDVIFSFNTLVEHGRPFYAAYYANVEAVRAVDDDTVHFDLADSESRELPLILGQMPVLPSHYWQDRDFTSPTRDALLGSGPYRIATIDPGRRIVYERVDDYWGADLGVNRGRHNIERLVYDYYRDSSVAMEAFKAGNLDLRIGATASNWATGYDFPAANQGFIQRLEIPDGQPAGMQAYVMNLRRDKFQHLALRKALNLAFNFEWLNKNLFYGAYERTHSYFANSQMAAEGLPDEGELALLEPHRDTLPEAVFDTPLPMATPQAPRARLRKAHAILGEAGFTYQDGVMRKPDGEPLNIEVLLHDTRFERVVQPLLQNLQRLGIEGNIRVVDVNQYLNRLRNFDFDIVVGSFPQSASPGNEQREYWGSEYADAPQSRNLIGLQDPVIDDLVDRLIAADSRDDLDTAAQALDRVLRWGFYVIPQWHLPATRLAFWDKLAWQEPFPEYRLDLDAWWIDPQRAQEIEARQSGG
ncbi:extracellular solute-binding protein [Halomonas sp. 18H]|uniref:extracellular solute-binding protein n=1 Tax=Halomonas almeriensis TaxID=308163 RepID=UPI00223037FA|nr:MULTISPECIES: extracellular solute-binding protein [Halomonas]MCW4151928.1 extracellular solute-binding protein [Halomonas sp. 18H]MDN3554163.1 extracellular solute-binding protein [Halomonas almeriensis]